LEDYSNIIYVSLEEQDYTTEVTESYTAVAKYNTNFTQNYENTSGTTKVGGSTGTSTEESYTISVTEKHTYNSNRLGTIGVDFVNPVITMEPQNCKYNFWWYYMQGADITFRPRLPY
jgi:hypothetical protein